MVIIYILSILILAVFAASYICYRLTFSVPKRNKKEFSLPDTEQYASYKKETKQMINNALSIPYEDVWIVSDDGLRLHGKFYSSSPEAPVQIMFHGYRSKAEVDFCGGLKIAVDSGFNVILVDQRAHGESEGRCLTFGVKECRDCLAWVNYAVEKFGKETKIMLYGMSMGAATVLMAAGFEMPDNVVGVVADCGYTSSSDIIKKVIADKHLPIFPTYMLIRLGGKLFGGFDLESASVVDSMKHCKMPVLFIHGGDDRFVPCEMGKTNYENCVAENKKLLIVPNAGHGISYMLDRKAYLKSLSEFLEIVLQKGDI